MTAVDKYLPPQTCVNNFQSLAQYVVCVPLLSDAQLDTVLIAEVMHQLHYH